MLRMSLLSPTVTSGGSGGYVYYEFCFITKTKGTFILQQGSGPLSPVNEVGRKGKHVSYPRHKFDFVSFIES